MEEEETQDDEIADGIIIYDLFDVRYETFEDDVMKENKVLFNEEGEIGLKLEKLIYKNANSEKIIGIFDEWLSKMNEDCDFWKKVYYQKGIVDALKERKYFFDLSSTLFEKNMLQNAQRESKSALLRVEMVSLICENIESDDIKDKILLQIDKMNNIEDKVEKFWKEKFYQKGYCDIKQLKKEVEEYQF